MLKVFLFHLLLSLTKIDSHVMNKKLSYARTSLQENETVGRVYYVDLLESLMRHDQRGHDWRGQSMSRLYLAI